MLPAPSSYPTAWLLRVMAIGFLLLGGKVFAAEKVTEVRIVGLEGLSEEDVLERLGGRLDFVTSRPPSRSRADDADFLVSRFLEKEGYSDVNIRWKIPSDRRSIILTVTSGPRLTLGEVTVNGVPPEIEATAKQFFTGSSLIGNVSVPYLVEKTETATTNVLSYLKAQGYWKAKTKLLPPDIVAQTRKVNLTLEVQLGLQHVIEEIAVDGTIPPELAKAPAQLQSYLGKIATAANLSEIQGNAGTRLRNEGYQFSFCSLAADHSNGKTKLRLTLTPGARYRLRKALLTGAEGVDTSRVSKLFQRSSGEYYDEEKIAKLRNSLLSTGAFDSVSQKRNIDTEEQAIDLTLHLKEGKQRGVTYYAGAGSLEGIIVGASYYDRNFLSKLYDLNVALEYSLNGFLGQVSVTDPFVFGYDVRATPRAFILSRTFDEYEKLEAGFGFNVSIDLSKQQLLEFDALLSFATVSEEDLPEAELGVTDYLLSTVGVTWRYDRRDSSSAPSSGFLARLRGEIGAVAAETPNAFLRLDAQLAYHYELSTTSRLGFNLQTGILAPTNPDDLPVDLRYFIGGDDSVRSFPTRELGPQVNGASRGGQSFWSINAEYIRKIAGPLYGVAFIDAGSLDEDASNWPSLDPKLAAGIGVRIDLPIGPVRLEYGHALNPSGDDPSGAFHFAIGAAF